MEHKRKFKDQEERARRGLIKIRSPDGHGQEFSRRRTLRSRASKQQNLIINTVKFDQTVPGVIMSGVNSKGSQLSTSQKETELHSPLPLESPTRFRQEPLEVEDRIQEKTPYSNILNPQVSMKIKLKMNNGCIAFKNCKKIIPFKFSFKKQETEKQYSRHMKQLQKNEFFKENPHLMEFARKQGKFKGVEDVPDSKGSKDKKRE